MSLVSLVILLVVVGFVLWLIQTYVPMEPTIKRIMTIVVIFVVVLYLLQALGLLQGLNAIRI